MLCFAVWPHDLCMVYMYLCCFTAWRDRGTKGTDDAFPARLQEDRVRVPAAGGCCDGCPGNRRSKPAQVSKPTAFKDRNNDRIVGAAVWHPAFDRQDDEESLSGALVELLDRESQSPVFMEGISYSLFRVADLGLVGAAQVLLRYGADLSFEGLWRILWFW